MQNENKSRHPKTLMTEYQYKLRHSIEQAEGNYKDKVEEIIRQARYAVRSKTAQAFKMRVADNNNNDY